MDSEAITRKYYSKLKSLPDMKILSGLATFESAIVIIRSIEIGLLYLVSFIIYFTLLSILFITEKKLIFFFIDLTAFFYIIFSYIIIGYYYYALTLFSPLIGYTLLPRTSELKSSLIILAINFASIAFHITYLNVIYIVMISLVFYYYIHLINKKGEKITGIKSLQILRPFLANIIKKDSKQLEKFLQDISIKSAIHIGIFKVNNIYFVLPKIHYGISGDIGSSKFIYQLESENPNNLIFHGPGSHEIDLATSTQSKAIAKLISDEEKKADNWVSLKFYGIKEWTCGEFSGVTLDFGDKSLSLVQRPSYGIDDLPLKLWNFIVNTGNYIVDCHNEYLERELPSNTYSCITNGILKSIKEKGEEKPFIVGYAEDKVKDCEGLCDNRIRVTYISDGEKDLSIIYIYSNNADPNLTVKIREKLKGVVNYPILVTPDDHSCTGTVFGDLYIPAQPCEQLVEKALELTLKAKSQALKTTISFKGIEIKGVKILGSIISLMVNALEEVGGYTMKTFWIPLVTPFILTIIFILLTNVHIKF
ncbi:DUF2070 family protein [Sulfurisphaera ohwakuensis]|uniref:DUF2070 family protein n=1 Tax=Sulfurisphaera ohwakuensis TaxID=69656 RepID=A0A650CEE9_SULOH|nr:DUF2070 family protein [Sulfurisphaera ohwakuensis]MBB5252920.1 putative membrane protein [Sulfurisphaera ohwakuensis]QGR16149.1 DUF2070 family protein [Sulfurisphaera ohwakuensis]